MSEFLWVKKHSDLNCKVTSLLFGDMERLSSLGNTFGHNARAKLPTSVFLLRTAEPGLSSVHSNSSK